MLAGKFDTFSSHVRKSSPISDWSDDFFFTCEERRLNHAMCIQMSFILAIGDVNITVVCI